MRTECARFLKDTVTTLMKSVKQNLDDAMEQIGGENEEKKAAQIPSIDSDVSI